MAAKQLCALVSVAILAGLGLVTIMLGGLPDNQTVAATSTPSFPPDKDPGTASVQQVSAPGLVNEPVRLSSDQGRPTHTTPVDELLDDDTTIAAPIENDEYDRLSRMP